MTSVATKPPLRRRPGAERDRRELPRRRADGSHPDGRATLDDRITAVWSRLVEVGSADCPVCGTEVPAGRPCGGCGSELS